MTLAVVIICVIVICIIVVAIVAHYYFDNNQKLVYRLKKAVKHKDKEIRYLKSQLKNK